MDVNRFEGFSRSLGDRSRRGVLRALALLGAVGLIDRLGPTATEAGPKKRKRRKGGKKGDNKSCPACTCPARDTCPARTCCICNGVSASPRCRYGVAVSNPGSTGEITASCDAACGGSGTWSQAVPTDGTPGRTVMCNGADNGCVAVRCPI